eukprot:3569631-Pyramimonas_sp.AAC.1
MSTREMCASQLEASRLVRWAVSVPWWASAGAVDPGEPRLEPPPWPPPLLVRAATQASCRAGRLSGWGAWRPLRTPV